MNTDVQTLESAIKAIESISDNSSDCGEFTDEQAQELATLAVNMPNLINRALQTLKQECDRLRDGPASMIEGDYVYYREPAASPVQLQGPGSSHEPPFLLSIRYVDGHGTWHTKLYLSECHRHQMQLLDDGSYYNAFEFIDAEGAKMRKEKYPELQKAILPSAEMVKRNIQQGRPGMPEKRGSDE